MSKNTGGSAFPRYEYDQKFGQMLAVGGMTLRDYFAAKTMANFNELRVDTRMLSLEEIASMCYEMADAMIFIRDK